MKKARVSKRCFICNCAFKEEIEQAKRKKVRQDLIYKKYAVLINYQGSFQAFRQMLYHHGKHSYYQPEDDPLRQALLKLGKETDVQALVDKLTILANRKVDELNPDEIKLKDVFDGQRVLIQIQKLKIAEDALSTMMAKMFGPKLKEEVIEGETVEQQAIEGDLSADRQEKTDAENTLLPAPAVQ
ncbi:MAG: hypothetical protein ACOYWZ_16160 [Bacillota bacterium]